MKRKILRQLVGVALIMLACVSMYLSAMTEVPAVSFILAVLVPSFSIPGIFILGSHSM